MATCLENNIVPHERRHGNTMHFAPAMQSVPQIMRLTTDFLMEELGSLPDIPSEEWVRLQFTPSNFWTERSKRFTARFNVKLGFQTRLTRKYHPDQKYGCVLFNYFKSFAVKYREYVSLSMLDDKCSIPIGYPDAPASCLRRQRRGYGAGECDAADHDHIQMHITPSVINMFGKPPRRVEDSFFGGEVAVILKCAIFEPSTAKRHMVELKKTYPKIESPVQMIYTDGGGDHRTPFISVQISYIAYFLQYDLDMLIAARTPPNLSVINPVERCNGTLNIGLNGVALGRDELDEDTEKIIKKFTSKKSWRNAQNDFINGIEGKIDYKIIVRKATENCYKLIKKRFSSLVYVGKKVKVVEKANEDNINIFYDVMKKIDEKMDWNCEKIKKINVMKSDRVKEFYKNHIVQTQYCFQIKKCSNPNCNFHSPIRMNKEVFKEVKWIPMPKLYDSEDKEEEKYLKFDEAYKILDKPDDCDRPGNTYLPKKTENTLVPKLNWRRFGQIIRK